MKPIKVPALQHLESRGWETETLPKLPVGSGGKDVLTTGDLDALLLDRGRYVGFEWETGNVDSTHRAMNKLLDGITRGTLSGGILALPMRSTQRYSAPPSTQSLLGWQRSSASRRRSTIASQLSISEPIQ